MRLQKSFRLGFNILLHSKLRSWLTIIGIVIGVAAVVAIISIGEGAQLNVQERLSGLGADLITISPGGGRASGGFSGGFGFRGGDNRQFGASSFELAVKNLTKKDMQAIKAVEGIKSMQGVVSGMAKAFYLAETATVSVDGVDPLVWKEMTSAE